MSQRNGTDSTGFALAVVAALIYVAMVMLFALAAFAALVLSLLCLAAWNKPLTIGVLTLEPPEARAFVVRGLIGTVVVPVFAAFCAVLFQTEIDPDHWPYLFLGGYTLGSVGIGILLAKAEESRAQEVLPPLGVQAEGAFAGPRLQGARSADEAGRKALGARRGRSPTMSFCKWVDVRNPLRAAGAEILAVGSCCWVGGGMAKATVDQTTMRGLGTA